MRPGVVDPSRGLVFVICAGLAGCTAEATPPEPPPPKVSVRHPTQRELRDYDEYNGWLDASEKVEVRARVRGHIKSVHFTDGQIVKRGDLLFELDPEPFKAEIAEAKARRNVYAAQENAAAKEAARQRELLTKGGASTRQVEKAEADVQSFVAQIAATDEEVRRRMLDLEYAQIKAEIGGRISKAQLTQGNLVNAGGSDPLLTTIYALDPVYAYFQIDERSLRKYAKGLGVDGKNFTELLAALKGRKTPFEFALEGEQGFPRHGELDFVEPRIDRATGTVQARGVVKNPQGQLVPGSRIKVRIAVSKPYQALLLPDTAVLSDQGQKYLLLVDGKNLVERRDVDLGRLLDDGMRVILQGQETGKGVTGNDWVIVEGLQRARVNDPVDPVRP
jgi:RND family efflux transporter MFP subunit